MTRHYHKRNGRRTTPPGWGASRPSPRPPPAPSPCDHERPSLTARLTWGALRLLGGLLGLVRTLLVALVLFAFGLLVGWRRFD